MDKHKYIIKSIIGFVFKFYCKFTNVLNDKSFILMYHRVFDYSDPITLYDPAMFVTNKTLQLHINELKHYFTIVPMDSYDNDLSKSYKPRCILTFDDGWVDNYYNALPVLANANVPAIIFLTANYINTNKSFWFHEIWDIADQCNTRNKVHAFSLYFNCEITYENSEQTLTEKNIAALIERLKHTKPENLDEIITNAYITLDLEKPDKPTMLNWSQVEEIGNTNVSIGSHGMNHLILTNLIYETKKAEVQESLNIFNKKGLHISNYFCYPNGNYDNEAIDIVKNSGFSGAIGTQLGYNTSETNKFCLNRIALHDDISSSVGLLWYRIYQAYLAGSTE